MDNKKIIIVCPMGRNNHVIERVRLAVNLKKIGYDVILALNRKDLFHDQFTDLNNYNIKIYDVKHMDKLNIYFIKGLLEFIDILKYENHIDIIHCEGLAHLLKIYFAKKLFHNEFKIFTTVGYLPRNENYINIIAKIYNLSNYNICLCNYTKNKLIEHNGNSNKLIKLTLNSPDIEWFDKNKCIHDDSFFIKYNLQKLDLTIPSLFYAASHQSWKKFDTYLKAAKIILQKKKVNIILGGNGPYNKYLKLLAKKLNIEKNIYFTGTIDISDMPKMLFNIADVCISTSNFEQLPTYILECMTAGKIIISTNVGGISELIKNDYNGYLINVGDFNTLSNKIINILDNNSYEQIGLLNRHIIEKKYSLYDICYNLLKYY